MDIRQELSKQGLSLNAATYIMAAVRPSTRRQYDVQNNKWLEFCRVNTLNPNVFPVNTIIHFLTYLKDVKKLSYKSVAAARLALGNYAVLINLQNEGLMSHPLISKLMKGMANLNPPTKTYQQIWNPQTVSDYLRQLPDNEKLSRLLLTQKVAILTALVTGSRCQTLHLVKRRRMTDTGDCFCCNVPVITKAAQIQHKEQVIHFPRYSEPKLCVYSAVKYCKELTDKYKHKEADKLFVTTRHPFKAAAQSTLAGWIRQCMANAGVDVSLYTTHSTRKAATSQAAEVSVPLGTFLKAAGWSNSHTFAQYYKLPVVQHDTFATAVLAPPGRASHFNEQ